MTVSDRTEWGQVVVLVLVCCVSCLAGTCSLRNMFVVIVAQYMPCAIDWL